MTLRCKPGDLVINVGGLQECRGEIYLVLRPCDLEIYRPFGPAWIVEHQGEEFHAQDKHLRPIRDPGEDAQDETLDWLPVPQQERSMA